MGWKTGFSEELAGFILIVEVQDTMYLNEVMISKWLKAHEMKELLAKAGL